MQQAATAIYIHLQGHQFRDLWSLRMIHKGHQGGECHQPLQPLLCFQGAREGGGRRGTLAFMGDQPTPPALAFEAFLRPGRFLSCEALGALALPCLPWL